MTEVRAVGAVLAIPTELVRPGSNARADIGDVTELAMSIKEDGQEEPITVYERGDGTYGVHEGHRRLAAIQKIHAPYVVAIVRRGLDDAHRLTKQVKIHAHRAAFNPMDEALAFHELMFRHGRTREEIARTIGKRPEFVRDRIALTRLTPAEQDLVRAGRLPVGEAVLRVASRRAELTGQPAPRSASRARRRTSTSAAHRPPARVQPAAPAPDGPPVITLCGPLRFEDAFRVAIRRLAFAGHPTFAPAFPVPGKPAPTAEERAVLRARHMRMIALADEILVINPGGYVGEDTAAEIAHAQQLGKPVRYLVTPAAESAAAA
ncbi:ParB/RepB/Spo0J family partition protein [Micromonospora haikouensis]|uniref:ParB/RepB/Spo0J family partition protein n=1 Tax=Micromonospora haikouensis TaxID=686309 RepID=UPI003D743DCE